MGVQFNRPGESEQPRVLLVSVPYALKASDAETLGGKPASAYLLAPSTVGADTAHEPSVIAAATVPVKPKAMPANSGMPNYIGKFTNTTDLIDSSMYEVNGNIGISTTTPLISLDARTGTLPQMGIAGTVDYLTFFASDQFGPAIYWDPAKDMRFGKGGTALYSASGFTEEMRIQSSTGNVGIGTKGPASKLDVVGDINLSGSLRMLTSPILTLPLGLNFGNLGLGLGALQSGIGEYVTAIGFYALQKNTGCCNTATGFGALTQNTTGGYNTANGYNALGLNVNGNFNTAMGQGALSVKLERG